MAKKFLYLVILLPILLTGAVLAWVVSRELKLAEAMNVPLPRFGEPTASSDPLVLKGQEVFNLKGCVFCHGPNGAGGVKNNNAQGGEIPSLARVAEGYTPEELKTKILTGVADVSKEVPAGPSPPLHMPAWKGHLAPEELDAVVAFLMSLAPKKASKDEW